MRARSASWLFALAALAAGCSSSHRPGQVIHGRILTVYVSGPTQGASSLSAAAALGGAQMALEEVRSRIGRYRIRLRALDDSTAQSSGWDPNQTTLDARSAAQDPTAAGYLGDYNSGASAISIPILNRAGIPQISAGSTAVGLTSTGPGAAPGEPDKYYPTGLRTFVRVVPTDAHQANALVRAGQARGCSLTFVLEDGEVDGEDAALSFLLTAQSAGLRVIGVQAFQRQALDYSGVVRSVAASGADCVLVSAIDEASAVRLTEQVARSLPRATIFATSALADSAYFEPAAGGLPATLDSRVIVVSPMLAASQYPRAGQVFLARYAQRFGAAPPSAIFGYEAMRLLLGAITRATDHGHRGAERARIRAEMFSDRVIRGAAGRFRINRSGDTSLARYAVYGLSGGRLVALSGLGG